MSSTEALVMVFLIGVIAGLRSLTAPAAVAWAACGRGILTNTPFHFMGSRVAAIIFTVLAIIELITDKLASTPSRLAAPGLIARIITGGLSVSCLAAAEGQSIALGAVLGVLGGVAGGFFCFGGFAPSGEGEKTPSCLVRV